MSDSYHRKIVGPKGRLPVYWTMEELLEDPGRCKTFKDRGDYPSWLVPYDKTELVEKYRKNQLARIQKDLIRPKKPEVLTGPGRVLAYERMVREQIETAKAKTTTGSSSSPEPGPESDGRTPTDDQ
jgi:hypothetical protein